MRDLRIASHRGYSRTQISLCFTLKSEAVGDLGTRLIGGWNAKSWSFVKDQKTVILIDDHDKTGKLQVCHVCYTQTFSLSFSFYRPRMRTFTLWEPPPREEAQMSLQYKLCEEKEKLLWTNQTKGRQRNRLKFNYRHSWTGFIVVVLVFDVLGKSFMEVYT